MRVDPKLYKKRDDERFDRFGDYTESNEDLSHLNSVEKLLLAVEASIYYLPSEVAEEIKAIFTPATLATMVGVFAVYLAAHATGIGQAMDIGMLVAGGIYFGLDAFAIFKDIAGFAGAVNATTPEELVKAGEHLALAVAKIGVDAVMTLLTKKVADRVAGVDEPGTTTGDIDEINYSIRKQNAPTNEQSIYDVENVGDEIVKNPLAKKAYQRINNQGSEVLIDYDRPSPSNIDGEFDPTTNKVHIYKRNNLTAKDAVGTMVHESTHVDYRYGKGIKNNTRYEEYRAAVRERMYRRSANPNIEQTRPSLKERREIWEQVNRNYSNLEVGKNPFTNEE